MIGVMYQVWLAIGIITSPVFAFEGARITPSEGVEFLAKVQSLIDVFQVNLDFLEKQAYQRVIPCRFNNVQFLSRIFQNNIQFICEYIDAFSKQYQHLLNQQLGKFMLSVSNDEPDNVKPMIVKSVTPWLSELKTLSIQSYGQAVNSLTLIENLKKRMSIYEEKINQKKQKLKNKMIDKEFFEKQENDQDELIFQFDEDIFVS